MDKKQTAVEWLKKELEQFGSPSNLNLNWTTFDELIDQAKQMEKEQIMDSYYQGGEDTPLTDKECEEYYNETYGANN